MIDRLIILLDRLLLPLRIKATDQPPMPLPLPKVPRATSFSNLPESPLIEVEACIKTNYKKIIVARERVDKYWIHSFFYS